MKLPAFNKWAECGRGILSFWKVVMGAGRVVSENGGALSWLGLDSLSPGTKSCIGPTPPHLPTQSHMHTENSLCLFIPNFVSIF